MSMPANSVRGTDGDQYWDANGILRVRTGSVPAVGTSPAHWGIAVYDASGNPIFDTYGLIAVKQALAVQNTGLINQTIVGPATKTVVTNSTVTFNLARQATVETFYRIIANSSGNFTYINAELDSTSDNNDETIINSLVYSNSTMMRLDTLAAGPHTVQMTADVDTGQTAGITKGQIKVFLLGG
jgi:hypothetical protein